MKSTLLYLLLAMLLVTPSFGQQAQEYFTQIEKIVSTEAFSSKLYETLDSLQAQKIASRSSISKYLDRELDLGYKHQRIFLQVNFEAFQIDLLTRSDSVLLSVISHDNYKKLQATNLNEVSVAEFLALRNAFYQSKKNIKDLAKEISSDITYAFYCGDGLPQTDEGKHIEKLVSKRNINTLNDMLHSFNIETQAYGVAGFKMLSKEGVELSKDQKKIIKHIKKRNSEVVTCRGCFTGLVEKVY